MSPKTSHVHMILTYRTAKGCHKHGRSLERITMYALEGQGAGEMAHSSRAHNLEEGPSSVPVTHIRRLAPAVTAPQLCMQVTLCKRKSFSCVSHSQQDQASPQPQMS